MIEVKDLTKVYGNKHAVDGISFTVNEGEILGFLGPNGAGKSTTMNILTGYISSTSGTAKVAGFDILEDPIEAKKHIGYLPEHPPLYLDMTVQAYLEFCYHLKKARQPMKAHLDDICARVRITDVRNRIIKNLSKGYKQRVGLAQAIIGFPEIIILDEPTVGLDPKQIIEIRELIRELAKEHTVILSSHILAEIQEVCDYIMIISKGKLVASDTPENLEKVSVEHGKEEGTVKVSLFPKDGKDIRETVFMAFAQEGCPLLMLYHSRTTLEDVFLELTQGSTPAAAKAMKDGEKKGWMVKRRKKNAQEEAEENELTEMDEEPEENAVPTSEDEKEDLENDSNL